MPLPAPYAPPWKRLGEDGVAMAAWLGLKAREWARRNREGTLPLPPFWPRRWFQLFWPLVLIGLLLAGLAGSRFWWAGGGGGGGNGRPGGEERVAPPSPQGTALLPGSAPGPLELPVAAPEFWKPAPGPMTSEPAPGHGREGEPAMPAQAKKRAIGVETGREAGWGETERRQGAQEPGKGAAEGDSAPAAPTVSEADSGTDSEADSRADSRADSEADSRADSQANSAANSTTDSEAEVSAKLLETAADSPDKADLLLVNWSGVDPDACIAAIRGEPAAATLILQLNNHCLQPSPAKRERRAERWLRRATELGYSHLRLEDGQRRVLGRDARVGGGLLFFQPAEPEGTPP